MKKINYKLLLFVIVSALFIISFTNNVKAEMINPHIIKWNIQSIKFVEELDLGQYKEAPPGCAVDPLPPGGDIIHNNASKPIKLNIKDVRESNILSAPKGGILAIVNIRSKAQKGDLTGRPDWWALDVGIGSGWIIPCIAVSVYSDAKGSIWTVKEEVKNKPALSMLTRHLSESQDIDITLVFKLEKWQIPQKGTNVKLLVLSPATQAQIS